MQDLRVSLIQADLYWEQPAANMAMFEEKIWSEVCDVDVIVLPEMFSTGFSMNAVDLAEPPHVNTFRWMKQVAKEKSALVLGSYIVRDDGQYYNRMYAVFPNGDSKHYDKKHLFTLAKEHQSYSPGQKRLIVEWKGWKICPMICYDLRFPVWSRNAYDKESAEFQFDVLVYSANWPKPRVDAWDSLLKSRAIENQCYTLGVNRVGVDGGGYEYSGHSGIYDHSGKQLAYNEEAEAILTANLNYDEMAEFREKFPFLKDADQYQIKS